MRRLYRVENCTQYLYIKDGNILREQINGYNYMYKYGDVPNDETKVYEDWKSFLKALGYISDFEGYLEKRKNRTYINDYQFHFGKVYKDQFEKFVVETKYKMFDEKDYPTIEKLEKDLGFASYSQLVFDRENELRSMMLATN